jgi:cation transport ATPase
MKTKGESVPALLSHSKSSNQVAKMNLSIPTGVKFAAVMIAMGLSLILVGLDNTILAHSNPHYH